MLLQKQKKTDSTNINVSRNQEITKKTIKIPKITLKSTKVTNKKTHVFERCTVTTPLHLGGVPPNQKLIIYR